MASTTSEEFEKATDYQFKEDDIERAKALVGRWSAVGGREFLTTVTPDAMRNFARGYGDDNPLYTTENHGTTTRWGGQVAAPMIPIALNRPLYGDPHAERIKRPSFRGIHVFVSGSSWEWFRPLQAGDGIYSFGGTESVVEKKSEFAERSLLIDLRQREDEPAGRDRRHLTHARHLHRAQDGAGERQVRRPLAGHVQRRGHGAPRRHLCRRGGAGLGGSVLGGRGGR